MRWRAARLTPPRRRATRSTSRLEGSRPAVPIGTKYRLIDVLISNCLHVGLRRVFALTQFYPVLPSWRSIRGVRNQRRSPRAEAGSASTSIQQTAPFLNSKPRRAPTSRAAS